MRLGVTGKFVALATGLVFLSTALWGWWNWRREEALLQDRLEQKGRILITSMALPFINALLYEEIGVIEEGGLLDTFIADVMAHTDISVVYAMVIDPRGKVLAHNRFSEFGKTYTDDLTRTALEADSFLRRPARYEGEEVWDLSYPLAIHGKHWGALRIGLSLRPLRAALARLAKEIAAFGGIFSLGALGVFALIGRRLAAPLLHLERHMETVGSEGFGPITASERRDEIGDLERSFNRMIQRMREAEEERETASRRLLENERLVAVGQLVAGVAHEVNNPLAAVDGALYHVDRHCDTEGARYVRVVRDGVGRVQQVVSQLVDLSRSGELTPEWVAIAELHSNATLFAKMALKKKAVQLKSSPPGATARIYVDRSKIHQVLLNLIVNAADAAGPDGEVALASGVEGGIAWFAVSDNGPGVPEPDRERIFEAFYTTKPAGKGSGMGLAISRRIAEGHGGSLTVDPDWEQGARFLLRIPATPPTSEPQAPS